MNTETQGQRISLMLNELKQSLKINNTEFAVSLGLTRGAVNQWKADQTEPTATNLFAIEKKYGYMALWIVTGEGPKRAPSKDFLKLSLCYEKADERGRDNIIRIAEIEAKNYKNRADGKSDDPDNHFPGYA